MILRLALRSLVVRPVRTIVLACGFGLGIAVMAVLLGVGEVILDQARSPALQGGGDAVIAGTVGGVDSARFVLSSVLGSGDLRTRVKTASPARRATLYLRTADSVLPVLAHGGIPSLEQQVGDPEVSGRSDWTDAPADARWTAPEPGDVLRAMDRFHAQPDVPEFAASWAEWLYFNGRTSDGRTRFYLTFLAGPQNREGTRTSGVRLQLERDGQQASYSATADVDAIALLTDAPDVTIGDNRVRLEGTRYEITLNLTGSRGDRLTGHLRLEASPGRSLPPAVIHGARGWLTGYTVPVLSGRFAGSLDVGSSMVSLESAEGYHDHNWGFWQDVRWQWGQVAHDGLSFVYGRVFPPQTVADPDRMPGFLGVLGPDGPLATSTDLTVTESGDAHAPSGLSIRARGRELDLRLQLTVDRIVRTAMTLTRGGENPAMDFLQLGGMFTVTGHAGSRAIDFTARGAAETFRPR